MGRIFRSKTGGHLSLYVSWRPEPIELFGDRSYETADSREITALTTCPEVEEARAPTALSRWSEKSVAALLPFHAALAERASAPCNIVVLGDSTEEGTGAGTLYTDRAKAWPDRVAALLRAWYPTTGETADQAPNYTAINTAGAVATGWTKGGTWAGSTQYGPNALPARSSSAGNTLTYTLPATTTGFEVFSLGGTSATGYTVTVDGGSASATQGSPGTGGTRDGVRSALFTVTPGSTHTVVITTVGNNNYIHGLCVYAGNETKGIRVFNAGKHGSRANLFANGGSYNWMPAAPAPTTLGGNQSVAALDPDLLIIGWGINDYTAAFTAADHRAALENIVAGVRAALPTKQIPVLILGKWRPNVASGSTSTWADHQAARTAMAAADPLVIYVDLGQFMPDIGSTQATTLGLYADTQHAVAAGYQMAADAIVELIAP